MSRILLVDDDASVLSALRRTLRQGIEGIEVEVFTDPAHALERAGLTRFDLVISDYRMPGMDGVAFLKRFRAVQPTCPRIILSAQADFNALIEAINTARIMRFLSKPWDNTHLIACVESAFSLHEQIRARQRLDPECPASPATARARENGLQAKPSCPSDITSVDWNPDGTLSLEALGGISRTVQRL